MSSKQYFICPITLELFDDPVITQDGYTYERTAIIQWINQYGTDPITKKPLRINQLKSNDAVKNFTQDTQATTNHENLDVLCLYCGSTQKLNTIKDHKLRCSSKPANSESFEIADNEKIFTISQTSSKNRSSRHKKIVSFHNPFTYRMNDTTNNNNNDSLQDTENRTNPVLVRDRCCSISKVQLKYLIPILLFIALIIASITLAVYYSTKKTEQFSTGAMITPHLSSPPSATWTASSTSVYIETTSSTSTFVETTSSTSTFIETTSSTSNTLCTSAEWDRYGITIVSNVDYPYGIAIDSEDNLIIASDEKLSLQKYLTNGTMIKLVTDSRIPSVFIDKFDNIYFTVALANRVDKLNSYDGSIITAAGGNGLGHGLDQLYLTGDPGIYVDQNSTLYISDTGNSRVMKYYENATSGIVVAGGHGQGSSSNQLNTPYGIYVDEIIEIGAIYICDQFNRRIQKWLPGAKEGITVAINNDQLRSPNAILLAPISNQMIMMMFISVFDHEKILKWIPYAKQAESVVAGSDHGVELEPDTLFGQRGMTFDKNWNLYVADTGHNRIQKFLFNISSCII